jgi:hypothetical protein
MYSMPDSSTEFLKIILQLSGKEPLLPLWTNMMMRIKSAKLPFSSRKLVDMIICPKLKKRSDSIYLSISI